MQTSLTLFSMYIILTLVQAGCTSGNTNSAPVVNASNVALDRLNSDKSREVLTNVTKIVAETLSLKPEEVGVDVPLMKQKNAADELDVVEIVLNVEDAYNIEIMDEELGSTNDDMTKNLTVRRLADIVRKKILAKE